MEISEMNPGPAWVPQACTLPTAEQPVRVAAPRAAVLDALARQAVTAAGLDS